MSVHSTEGRTYRDLLAREFAQYDITIDGENPDIIIRDDSACERILKDPAFEFGNTYRDFLWDEGAATIDVLAARLTKNGIPRSWLRSPSMLELLRRHRSDQQSVEQSTRVAREHYDISPRVFHLMLGRWMQYSCAYFGPGISDLDDADICKLYRLGRMLAVKPGMRVLDIGCGFSTLGLFFVLYFGASEVVGVTLSRGQAAEGEEICKGFPVRRLVRDYRKLPEMGQFDRIISVGMFEHVGMPHYEEFFEVWDRHLKPEGIGVLHTIAGGGALPFNEKYIFPGGWLPTQRQIERASQKKGFVPLAWHNIGKHYDTTCMHWRRNFDTGIDLSSKPRATMKCSVGR